MILEKRFARMIVFLSSLAVVAGMMPRPAAAQYAITNLVSNQTGQAKHVDPDLVNAWGLSYSPSGPIWISDEGTGLSTFYDNKGNKAGTVTIPGASGGTGSPTGQVYNSTQDFKIKQGSNSGPAYFIFDTFDGTISGWNPTVNSSTAVIAVTKTGASFTGLAMGSNNGANFLFAADNANNEVDIYDGSFNFVTLFTDSGLSGLSVYNVQNIGGQLYVTFTDSAFPPTKGAVDIFDTAGNLIKNFSKSANLKGPWGVALAPKNFGPASKALLVGNLGDGKINYFNVKTGKLLGQLKSTKKKVISIDGLWGLAFGHSGSDGKPNQLFFTAGPNSYADGLYGVINFK